LNSGGFEVGVEMKILFLNKSSFDSLGKQAINVLRIDVAECFQQESLKSKTFFHKILTDISHQRRLANRHECNEVYLSLNIQKFHLNNQLEADKPFYFVI